ncbi:MAG: MFS transporter [Actinomycetota bacterium]|nr:MFS transporter [Actinomycetota bacterium]
MSIYGRILRVPRVAVLIVSTTITRLPFAINGLAVILFLRETTGSFATAGLTAGALALGAGVGAPLAARFVDRRGIGILMPMALVHAAAVLAIWALGAAGASTTALVATAALAGTAFPPTGSVLRSRWPELLRNDTTLIRGAYALDSVSIEVSFVTGPLITAGLVLITGPQAALAVSALLVVAGTALFIWKLPHSAAHDEPGDPAGLLGALRAPAMRLVALTTVPVGFCIGAIEVSIPAFSEEVGHAALAGVLLALWSLASGIGGLVFGARAIRRELLHTYIAISILFPLACLPMIAASSPATMCLLVLLAGAPIAPLIATRNELIASVAPPGTGTEAFTWLVTSLVAGLSVGTAVGGAVIEAEGWPAAVALGVGVAMAGALVGYARRGVLAPAPA